jgi:hypothetical protein
MENEKDLNEFLNRTGLKNIAWKPLRFLIHSIEDIKLEKLKIHPLTFNEGHIGHFSYFLIETLKEIQLKTLEWFTEKSCNIQHEILINTFHKKNKTWSSSFDIEEKFTNFYSCILQTFSSIFNFYTLYATERVDLITKIYPFEIDLVNAIAKVGNFTPKFNWLGTEDFLQIYFLTRMDSIDDDCQLTSYFWEDNTFIATSPAESYNSYEKLFLTFDFTTWMFLFGTFMCAFIVIFIVSKMSKTIQEKILGENVKCPSMNVIGLLFGLGQTKLPKNNCARIILMSYILFCIVINTAYHGETFN